MPETTQSNQSDDSRESLPSEELESLYEEFESAWVKTPYPDLRGYLSSYSSQSGSEFQAAALVELIQIDLERRWKSDGNVPATDPLPARPQVKDYVAALPECRSLDDVPVELLAFEFRVRHLWGDAPNISDFVGQFPERGAALQDACEKVTSNLSTHATQNLPPADNGRPGCSNTEQTAVTDERGIAPQTAEKSFRSLSEGMQISHYTLRRQIGKGGFGVVFEAQNLDRPYQQCAIKLIRPDLVARPKLAERFKQEITALTGLSHPNIACATDHGEWEGVVYLVLEYVDGLPVNGFVRRQPRLSLADACELVRQAAIGLQHIHEKQRTHRDIKPSNLMVTTDGTVKILDLGLARLTDIEDEEERLTSLGDVMGTPDYMAPEQWQDSSKVDIRGDVYSLGCTLYCLLAGQPPFATSAQFDPVALMRAHSESPIPDIAVKRDGVPEAVRKLIADCMAKRPQDRPAEPQDIADRLAPFVSEAQLAALNEPPGGAVQASANQTIDELIKGASENPPGSETLVEPARSQQVSTQQSEISPRTQAIDAGETLIESVVATKVPSFEETLTQHSDDLNSTLAEQSIKPTGSTRRSDSQQSGSTSSMMRSYSTSGSVVLTPRQLTHGKVTGIDNAEYEIGAKLGEGGMGAVYRARQGSVDRGVALKMVKKNQGPADAQDMFLAEAVVTGALEHPNIVPIYDLGVNTDDELFYAMKEVQGHAWTDSIDAVSLEENLEVIAKVSDAIAFSHEKGIVHRDLKPDNIMIGQFGEVVVMDWGLALPTDKFEKSGLPFTQGLAGTPSYMSPEMADLSLAPIGPPADIYLLGALLFRAVTKRAPHTGKHAMAALRAAAVNTVQWPSDDEAGHDQELLDIARKAMATRPEDRYGTATVFKQALRDYRSHSESRRLTDSAIDELKDAEASSSYRSFERSIAALEEAIKLWAENVRASETLQTARLRYGQAAFQKGDLDLAELQLDDNDLAHTQLLKSIRETRAEREVQAQRLRRMKQTAAGLAAVVFLTVSVSAVMINSARNKEKAAKEQEAIAKTEAVQRFRESQSTIAELSQLADALRDYPLAQAERQQLLEAVTDYYDRQTSKQSDVPELRIEQLRSLVRLGEVFNQLAEYSKAIKTWDRSTELAINLGENDTFGTEASILHAQSLGGRAQSLLATGDHPAARLSNNDAVTRLTGVAEKSDDTELQIELATMRLQQAKIEKAVGQYSAALSQLTTAIEALQTIVDTDSSSRANAELGVAFGLQTQILELTGNYAYAAVSADKAVGLWKKLTSRHPDEVRYADGLATSQIDAANVLRVAGRDPLDDYEAAVATFQQLVELRPGIPRYRFNLATALSGLAWTKNRLAETESAQESAVQSVNTLLFLSERFPEDIRFPLGEVSARLVLAEILRDRGDFEIAVGIVEQASESLGNENIPPDSPQSRERFGELLLMFGQLQSAIGDSPLAQDSFRQSAETLLELAASDVGLPRHRDSAAWAMYYLSHELAKAGDNSDAETAIKSAIEIRTDLPQRAAWRDSFAWLLLTSPIESLRDASRAESLAASAAKLASESPRFLRTLALAQLRTGSLEPAAESLKTAEVLMESEHPEQHLLKSMLAFKQGDNDQARQLYTAGTALMEIASPSNPRLLTMKREAAALIGIVVPVRKDVPDAPAEPTN
jgi:serine/threonine protein kinase